MHPEDSAALPAAPPTANPAPGRVPRLPEIDPRRCTGCGRCVAACGLHLLSLQTQGWEKFATLQEPGACTGCSLCAVACPFRAISMHAARPEYPGSAPAPEGVR
jgi:ferredoxin